MAKMWAGVTAGKTDPTADDFNSSIRFDRRMFRQDITGSIAHAAMLSAKGILSEADCSALTEGLTGILEDLEAGTLEIDGSCEDIHMFVEQVLTERIGEVGKKLHTARSRNDQVALDLRMYLRDECGGISGQIHGLLKVLTDLAEENKSSIMPGYTHLQRAQPVSFGHYMMAYASMLLRDLDRIADCRKRMNISPIGCCALDRDFAVELLSALSILMMHLSRLSEELILWASWEFRFITLSDAYTTGSSIMPQKRNADMAELVRGKTGRVYGDLMGLLTVLKGLPLAYNKDMQEDKEGVFDACDTVKMSLTVLTPMLQTMQVNAENMLHAAQEGFINATDLADYLVRKGMPFRSAYKISGQLVALCMKEGTVLEHLPLSRYREYSELFEADLYNAIDLKTCMEKRSSEGGTSVASVEKQIAAVRVILEGYSE